MIKLGIVGESPGNGHPFSWSAILNGYDARKMEDCGYPAIPRYLEGENVGANSGINGQVVGIYCQSEKRARKIAETVAIPFVAPSLESLLGESDAVLLARDDSVERRELVRAILAFGLPVLIDKPFETSRTIAAEILESRLYEHQVMSASALVYSRALRPQSPQVKKIGLIRRITASVPKDWATYSVHAIEPSLNLLDYHRGGFTVRDATRSKNSTKLFVGFSNGQELVLETRGSSGGEASFELEGEFGQLRLLFDDTFASFHELLRRFVSSVETGQQCLDEHQVLQTVELIEAGLNA